MWPLASIAAGTVITATVEGATDGIWAIQPIWDLPNAAEIEATVQATLGQFGTVAYVRVYFTNFNRTRYRADVQYTTARDHASREDVRATLAGVFQVVTGSRPGVLFVGESVPMSAEASDDPSDWLGDLKWIVVGLVVLVAFAGLAPTIRRVQS